MARKTKLDRQQLQHFVHLSKRKYRKQRSALKSLFKDDAYRIEPDVKVTDRSIFKYWKTRHRLFSRMQTKDLYMTRELWFSVTPESLAKFAARFIKSCLPDAQVVLDVYCGGGGNTIQFAQYFQKVYGVDSSLEHLYCTYRNAQAYNVEDRIWLKYGDWPTMSRKGRFEKLQIDCVFSSPPWGGPQYLNSELYDLENALQPRGLRETLQGLLRVSENVVMFLPRNSDLGQVSQVTRELLGNEALCKVIYVKDNGYLKGIMCFWGEKFYNYSSPTTTEGPATENVSPSVDYAIDG
ncbi:LAME_0F12288g1_1 [Lachancea meyersii CBS 8951]|uniref:Trimethylguanosine synthase n=1 Tax=Lachancea meyersii CBS 8951 TaxID=1266667 RepID=A0A1G4JWT5_9SACH|nr:LAME_0F12288g1_1 [Lachancea meyersii CBS 8951]